jgi:flagellar protein FliS
MTIHNNFQRAQDIVRELNRALNMEQGGDCADTFRQLYDYFDRKIVESNLKKRPEGAREVIKHLTVMRDAWAVMLANQGMPPAAVTGRAVELAAA